MIDSDPYQSTSPRPAGEWDQFTRQAAIVILLLVVLLMIWALRPLLNLLGVTGIFILILLYPVNKLRAKTRLAHPAAVFIVFIPIALILFLLVGNLVRWSGENIQSMMNGLQGNPEFAQSVDAFMAQFPESTAVIVNLLKNLLTIITRQIYSVMWFIALIVTSFFLAFLFILEMPNNLAHSFEEMSDVSRREFGILFGHLSMIWNGWLRSTVITSIIIGSTTALELFVFGIPYPGILGVISGLLNLIPTIGAFFAYLIVCVVTFTEGSSYLTLNPMALTLLVLIVNVCINQFVRLVIFPRLAGKAVHLPVFMVILGLVVAAVLWGVVGVILVVPLLGTAREILSYLMRKINRKDPFPGEELQTGLLRQGPPLIAMQGKYE